MITARQNFRYLIDKQLGGPGVTTAQRMADAMLARRCRNLFWGAMGPVLFNVFPRIADLVITAQTDPFAHPIIITDILDFTRDAEPDACACLMQAQTFVRLFSTGGLQGGGTQEDFFGVGNFSVPSLTYGYDKNEVIDSPSSVKMHFQPYLMSPWQIFRAQWEQLDYLNDDVELPFNPELHFRGVRVLEQGDTYGQLCGVLKQQVCSYIERYDTETFILDLEIPTANLPAAGVSRAFATPLQERPLLVLGIATNINGAQVNVRDDSVQWDFVVPPTVPRTALNNGAVVVGAYPRIVGLPLYVVAANGDMTRHEAYNMLPVPHLLAPNTSLIFRLTNGLRAAGGSATFTQTINTQTSSGTSTGNAHIALLCRTV